MLCSRKERRLNYLGTVVSSRLFLPSAMREGSVAARSPPASNFAIIFRTLLLSSGIIQVVLAPCTLPSNVDAFVKSVRGEYTSSWEHRKTSSIHPLHTHPGRVPLTCRWPRAGHLPPMTEEKTKTVVLNNPHDPRKMAPGTQAS